MQEKIRTIEDFIHSPKHKNSLDNFLAKNENPLENGTIARLLAMTPDEVEAIYQESIKEFKKEMNEDESGDL
jgi:hypothetical protein